MHLGARDHLLTLSLELQVNDLDLKDHDVEEEVHEPVHDRRETNVQLVAVGQGPRDGILSDVAPDVLVQRELHQVAEHEGEEDGDGLGGEDWEVLVRGDHGHDSVQHELQ